MLDLFGFPQSPDSHVSMLTNTSGQFVAWNKPRGATMMFVWMISGGGSGGGGQTGAAGTGRTGAGGGGSSSITKAIIPLILLPDTIFYLVGAGGAAPAANTAGNAGSLSYLSISPITTSSNVLLASGTAAPTGGAVSGTAGAAGTILATGTGTANLKDLLFWQSAAGTAGGTGGANTGANGGAISSGNFPLFSGTGGGGTPAANTDFTGGSYTSAGVFQGVAGGVAPSGDGNSGFLHNRHGLFNYGGTGGGTAGASGVGGKGGDGSFGSGGGGGGGGVTGGAGGKGGDGLIIIAVW